MAGSEGIGSSGARKRNREPGIRPPVRRRRPGSRIDSSPPALAGPQAGRISRARRRLSKIVSSWGPSPTFRIFLFRGGFLATMGFLLYNEYVIDQLRRQERNRAALYANLVQVVGRGQTVEVIFNPEIDFPIVVTDHRGEVVLVKGEGLPAASDTSAAATARLRRVLERMDARHKPVRFFESPLARGLVYFDGANLVLTDLSGRLVTWSGPDLPAADDSTGAAFSKAAAALRVLRAEVAPDSVAVAADGRSSLYLDGDRFLVVDSSGKVAAWGGNRLPANRSPAALEEVQRAAKTWPIGSPPVSFRIPTEKFIHFGQSDMIGQISLAPLVSLAALVIFGLIGYIGFRNIRRSEQRSIWIGMAKETADQLGTPLSSLAGWLELMAGSRGKGPEERDAIVREMQKDMRRLNQIASRFSQTGSVPELRPTDVGSVIAETIGYFRGRGPQFGRHVFEVDLGDLPRVPLNAELMGWAFENLFKNAIDAIGGKEGTIVVRARLRDPETVSITVRDNGRGIDADSVARVFQPGFSTRKRGCLGLAFVKRIVEEYHGGRIQIADSAAGRGTTFRMELPVRGEAPAPATSRVRERSDGVQPVEGALGGRRDRHAPLTLPVPQGARLRGNAGQQRRGRHRPDAPRAFRHRASRRDDAGLDGLATVEKVKDRDPHVPVIMITKNEEERLMDEAIGRRLDDYLTKPVNPSQIFMACRKILDSRQIRRNQAGPAYVSQANQIREWLSGPQTWHTWIDIHRLLCEWDIEISRIGERGLMRMIEGQRRECNQEFARFVEREYPTWVRSEEDSPPLSVDVVRENVAPHLRAGKQVFFIVIDKISRMDALVVLTTDHGAVRGRRATVVHGDRQTSPSLRYKRGRNLRCDSKGSLLVAEPLAYGLPEVGLGGHYLIAKEDFFFVYPKNCQEYQRHYRDSFQHGGISLEEMILPMVTLEPR